MTADLRLGRWQDVLADVEMVDAVITDPPYSQRVEGGFRTNRGGKVAHASGVGYDPIDERWCYEFLDSWKHRCRGWVVVCCDHIAFAWWEQAARDCGLYTFPPVVIVKTRSNPRMSCDGPGSHAEYMMVARPRRKEFIGWGSLPGWYSMQTVRAGHGYNGITGSKSMPFMREVTRDYSRPGDLICDPCAGGGTTLLAATMDGRRAVGSEMDPNTYEIARQRLLGMGPATKTQGNLFLGWSERR